MKKLIIIILLIFTGINLYAQCYKGNISLGNYAKSKGNYTEAIRYFKKAKLCSDKPTNDSLDELISECERLQSAPKKTQPQQRKTQTQQSKPSVILKVDGHSDVCNQNLYSYGSSIVFSITTNQSYYYITDAQNKWFSVTKEGKEIRVKYPANNTGSVRSGYFYVKAGNKSVRVNLRQYSETPALRDYSLSVSPESYTFPAYGGQTKIYVNTNSPSGYTLAQTHSSMFKITAQ